MQCWIKKKLPQGKITSNLLNNYSVGILTMIVDKQVFEEFSFNPKYSIIGDFDFVLKLSIKSKFACVDEPLAYHRKHEKNFSSLNLETVLFARFPWGDCHRLGLVSDFLVRRIHAHEQNRNRHIYNMHTRPMQLIILFFPLMMKIII